MILTLAFDRGQGEELVRVGPMAQVAYEVENRTKISKLVDGIGVVDMTDLAYRQLVVEGRAPASLADFRTSLVDINPVDASDPS
jgi:hypothetical protein